MKAYALAEGLISPNGPASLLDLSGDHFITYLESLARRIFGDERIDELYGPEEPVPFVRTADRARQIRELEAMFAG